jgi:hypothetical protein
MLSNLSAWAQVDSVKSDSIYKANNTILPAIGSTPETGFLFGGIWMRQFKPGSAGPETRTSSFLLSGIYTVKGQLLLSFLPEIITRQEQWIFKGVYGYNYFPQNYWGIGPQTSDADERKVFFRQWNIEQSGLLEMASQLHAGPILHVSHVYDISMENPDGDAVPVPNVTGFTGSWAIGMGGVLRWDRRNSIQTPTKEHFLSLTVLGYPEFLGTTRSYSSTELDVRKYWDLGKKEGSSVIAAQFLGQWRTGHPPFWDYARLGGDVIMRGYYEGRYRDLSALQTQVEWRQQVYRRWGITTFASTGEVFHSLSDGISDNVKWTMGGGDPL